MTFKKDLILLFKPYYFVNLLMSLSFLILKKTPILCNLVHPILFATEDEICELDGRETEILFFLIIVVMIRSRKTGSVTMINYLTSSFMYTKIANLILWFYSDVKLGVIYAILFVITALLIPEPTYQGPEKLIYFRTETSLDDEIEREPRISWIVAFYTTWNPSCANFAPIFAEISNEYHLDNLKFGKVDIGRLPEVGKKYHVSDSSLSRQLPTIILFRNGKEAVRRPFADSKGKLVKFYFSSDNVKAAFDLNNLYKDCKENPIKKVKAIEKKNE